MSRSVSNAGTRLAGFGHRWLPFADAASADLSLGRLLRLSLFQLSTGMAIVLLTGTLNRVMVVELGQPASWVSLMLAIPLLMAPARALIGYRSDHHRSYLGWRRIPFLWSGTMMQFGGLAFMPFALILMTEPHSGPAFLGPAAAMASFLLTGLGMHVAQTAGLALATDLATEDTRPRVVALLYLMLLIGMIGSALIFAALLEDFGYVRLIQVIQSAAVITLVLNVVAMLKRDGLLKTVNSSSTISATFEQAREMHAELLAGHEQPSDLPDSIKGVLAIGDTGAGTSIGGRAAPRATVN